MIGRSAGMRSQEQVKNISETNRQLLRVNARKSCLFLFAQVLLVIPIRVSQFLGIQKTTFSNALQNAPAIVLHRSIFASFCPCLGLALRFQFQDDLAQLPFIKVSPALLRVQRPLLGFEQIVKGEHRLTERRRAA